MNHTPPTHTLSTPPSLLRASLASDAGPVMAEQLLLLTSSEVNMNGDTLKHTA